MRISHKNFMEVDHLENQEDTCSSTHDEASQPSWLCQPLVAWWMAFPLIKAVPVCAKHHGKMNGMHAEHTSTESQT